MATPFENLGLPALSAFDRPMAIWRDAIPGLIQRAQHPDLDALASRLGKPIESDGGPVANHNGTAVLDIRGPLFRYRSIWTWLLGGHAIEQSALALQAALDDPTVHSIVLAINSPGGQVDGINEFANMIRAANGVKPVTAYVDGMAASGAYWLAAAAGKIVADETAQLGSIGVLATVFDDRGADEKMGIKRFDVVSSQSPLKRTDPSTDEGRAQLQQMVDSLAQLFIDKVAQFRGTDAEDVERNYGRGAVMLAGPAIAAGMADEMGSLAGLLTASNSPMMERMKNLPGMRIEAAADGTEFDEDELEEGTEAQNLNNNTDCTCPPGTEDCECDDDTDESEGTEQEPDDSSIPEGEADLIKPTEDTQRIAAILNCEEAKGREQLAQTIALKTNHSLEAAKELLSVCPKAPNANPLEARMDQLANPIVGVTGEAGREDSNEAEVARIMAFVPKQARRPHLQ